MAEIKLTTAPARSPALKPYTRKPVWRRAALIYNPMAGQQREQRRARIAAALAVLRKAGVNAEAIATLGPGTAGSQAQEAVARGFDVVLACGGDGTVNEVLQGMVGSSAALGVIPLGTANALAADIGVPRNTAAAARTLLNAEPAQVAVARIECDDGEDNIVSRYFIAAAGVGPDAHIFYALQGAAKGRLGYAAYYARAMHTWATHHYPPFAAEITSPAGEVRHERVTQVLAVRIGNFGGVLRHLAPGAALESPNLRLVLFKTRNRWLYMAFLVAVFAGLNPQVPGVELVDAVSVTCHAVSAGNGSIIRAEADGELLGRLPAKLSMAAEKVKLLMPNKARR